MKSVDEFYQGYQVRIGRYLAELAEERINILHLCSTADVGVPGYSEYFVGFEYAIPDRSFENNRRWVKMCISIHAPTHSMERIATEVLAVVRAARAAKVESEK